MATSRERIAARRHEKLMKRYLNFPLCPTDKQKAVRYISPEGRIYYHSSNDLSLIKRVFDLVLDGESVTRRFIDKDENNWGQGAEVHTATGIQIRFVGYTTMMNAQSANDKDLPEAILDLVREIKGASLPRKKERKAAPAKVEQKIVGAVGVKEVAGILGVPPAALRRALRKVFKEKPAEGWSWHAGEVDQLIDRIKGEL